MKNIKHLVYYTPYIIYLFIINKQADAKKKTIFTIKSHDEKKSV